MSPVIAQAKKNAQMYAQNYERCLEEIRFQALLNRIMEFTAIMDEVWLDLNRGQMECGFIDATDHYYVSMLKTHDGNMLLYVNDIPFNNVVRAAEYLAANTI